MHYIIVIEKAEGNYSAYSPDVLGCITTGDTVEETLRNMKEAIEFHLEGTIDAGEPVPQALGIRYHLDHENIFIEDDVLIAQLEVPLPHKAVA